MERVKFEERLKKFTLDVLALLKTLPKTEENKIFGKQLIRSTSSIGANYAESAFAHSKQDFTHILNIARKEANESLYWLKMLKEVNLNDTFLPLIDENYQILKIFISSVKTSRQGGKNGR